MLVDTLVLDIDSTTKLTHVPHGSFHTQCLVCIRWLIRKVFQPEVVSLSHEQYESQNKRAKAYGHISPQSSLTNNVCSITISSRGLSIIELMQAKQFSTLRTIARYKNHSASTVLVHITKRKKRRTLTLVFPIIRASTTRAKIGFYLCQDRRDSPMRSATITRRKSCQVSFMLQLMAETPSHVIP